MRADSEYHISFHSLSSFSDQNPLNIHEKVTKLRLKNSMLSHFLGAHIFLTYKRHDFVAFKMSYQTWVIRILVPSILRFEYL